MSSPKVWFITGASSGFGRSMTEYALNQGDIVVATLCEPQVLSDLAAQYPASMLLVLQVDVTKQEDIDEAFACTRLTFEWLDVVFNNAGYALITEIEGTPVDKAREIFETNFWGATNVNCAATCIIEPGAFHTNANKETHSLPQHPAYTNESFATSVLRQRLDGAVFEGDVRKDCIPKQLPMGLDALEALNVRIEDLKVTVDETKGWSVDLKRADG
ncbi:NAD(P)-binding protein [Suillus decipiens]|nr:NAD(P)-binding protein [Suillus decipiens]